MDPVFINNATVIVGEAQTEYIGLPVRQTTIAWLDEKGRTREAIALVSEWRPNEGELRALNEGASIFLSLLNVFQHPPVILGVGPASELAEDTIIKGRPA